MATTLYASTPHDADADTLQRQLDEDICRLARQRWKQAVEEDARLDELMLEDLRFENGEQWDERLRLQRERDRRPALTVNRLLPVIRQVTNDERQQRPSIKIRPVSQGADEDTAQALQGLIRHIEADSHADIAYDTAFAQAVGPGRGYFRILTEYESEWSFQQVLKIRRIPDPFCVRVSRCREPDYSDMVWGFLAEDMDRDQFCQLYEVDAQSWSGWQRARGSDWVRKNTVRVAEYFTRETLKMQLALLADGQTVRTLPTAPDTEPREGTSQPVHNIHQALLAATIQARLARQGVQPLAPGEEAHVIGQRWTQVPVILHYKLNGHQILERSVWPGRFIPLIPVLGDEVVIQGEVHLSGIVRHAKDSQRMYNLWTSSQAETIGQAPRAPYIGAKGQFQNREKDWQQANIRNFAYLEYDPISIGGQVVPPPQRQTFEPPIQAISTARLQSAEDIDATTGIYPATRGQPSNEKSGKAIQLRAQQSDQSNFHYGDNLTRALRQCGRILLDAIPQVYDEQRVIRILGEDGGHKRVMLQPGAQPQAQATPEMMANGIEGIFDLSVGTYDVLVDVGPSYHTKRQETVDTMLELSKAVPQVGQIGPDILVQNMDFQEAETLARRLKKTLPPGVVEDEGQKPEDQVAQLQAAMQQSQQQLQALDAYAQQAEAELKQMQQENEQLKGDQQGKMADLQVKREEMQQRSQLEWTKVQMEQERLKLEWAKLELERQEQLRGHAEHARDRDAAQTQERSHD